MRSASVLLLLASCVPLPEQPLVALGPDDATTVDDLVLQINDPEGQRDDVSYAVVWSRDGATVDALADAHTVPATETSKGERWEVRVTPLNRRDREGEIGTAELVIANTPPVAEAVAILPEAPTRVTGATASATGVDVDGDTITWSYAWTLEGVSIGEDSDAIAGDALVRGETLRVVATPSDGEIEGPAVSAEVSVGNALPSLEAVSLAPADPRTLSVLTASATGMADPDGDAVEVIFSFHVDGVAVHEVRSDSGTATLDGATYFAKGQTVAVVATPTDGFDSGPAVTSDEVVVLNTPPTAPSVAITPEAPTVSDDLVCDITTPATDVDGDGLSYDIAWSRDGAEWSGATGRTTYEGDTIAGRDTSGGELWTCTVMAWDGETFGPDAVSDEVEVVDCGNPGGGALQHDNGVGEGVTYCYNADDSLEVKARKACESHHGVGECCVISGGYRSEQYGLCGAGGGSGTIHWHPDSWPSGHCGPEYVPGDVVSPGWCGSIVGSFLP